MNFKEFNEVLDDIIKTLNDNIKYIHEKLEYLYFNIKNVQRKEKINQIEDILKTMKFKGEITK